MGLVNDKFRLAFETEDALDDTGYLLTFGSSAGKVALASSGDVLVGINLVDTVSPFTGSAEANKMVAVLPLVDGMVVELKVADANQAISYGAPLCIDSAEAGKVDYRDGTNETGAVIAYALEAVDANSGGTVKAIIMKE